MIRPPLLVTTLFAALATAAWADGPIVLADFEGENYGAWSVEGEAFGAAPARGTLPGQMSVDGYLGDGLVNSFHGGDGTTGTLTSPPFTIERDLVWFLIGGGGFEGQTCINLIVDGEVVRSATGPNTEPGGSEFLRPHAWDVRDLKGQTARLKIIDAATGGWGHINVDHIVLCDEPPELPGQRTRLLERAERSVAQAAARVAGDPSRPAFHFRPPAQWMNDPNGTIYHNGYYHLFYQHNPYGDTWGHMHWGHARSRDLVRWEHLPIALWPSKRTGEDHVFSGGAAVNGEDQLMLFYTSVGAGRPNEQWAALPTDEDGLAWKKHPANPLITVEQPDGVTFANGMRDPYIFRHNGHAFMVVGADVEDEAVLPLYEARDESLADWAYKGIIWRAPKDVMRFPECPNFFPLGDRFVLLTSPYRPVEYRVGEFDLDALTFAPETTGRLDHSDQFYATNTATAPDGRCILFGWVRGFPEGQGWNGCLALPRELTIGDDGHPRQRPVSELESLRGPRREWPRAAGRLDDGNEATVPGLAGDGLEIEATLIPTRASGRFGLRFRGSDGAPIAEIVRSGDALDVAGVSVPLGPLEAGEPLSLRAFLDRTVLEVFINDGRHVVTRVIPFQGGDVTPAVFSEGTALDIETLGGYELKSIWPDAAE